MILFVFEGEEREPMLYKTLEKIYFPKRNNNIICSFRNNIYELYKELKEMDCDGDVVSVLRERLSKRKDSTLDGLKSADFSEIYLFFDYDFQHAHLSFVEINKRVEEMLQLFCEETENGKLYINYPMVESIRYTKELPDSNYVNYAVDREDCRDFKRIANDFSYYNSFDYILFKEGESPTKDKFNRIKDNWTYLKKMNVSKANYIVSGKYEMPANKSDINQEMIFKKQKYKYIEANDCVAVLNSFPIFIYEYFK